MTTMRRPRASNACPSRSPVRPYPAISRKGSRSRATRRVKRCRASAWRKLRSCTSESSDPMAYAQPMTVR